MPLNKKPDIEDAKDQRTTMRTLHIRIRDKHAKYLRACAYDVNQVWNFCNALSIKVFERKRRFMSGYGAGAPNSACPCCTGKSDLSSLHGPGRAAVHDASHTHP